MESRTADREELLALTADIVSSHVSNNTVSVSDLPGLISSIFDALSGLGNKTAETETKAEPAVPIRSSIKQEYIVCLEDGRKLKTLKRHLATRYNMTPEQYRAKWNLPASYPMVAPAYAERRRLLAKNMGLGRKPAPQAAAKPASAPIEVPAPKPVKLAAEAKAPKAPKAPEKAPKAATEAKTPKVTVEPKAPKADAKAKTAKEPKAPKAPKASKASAKDEPKKAAAAKAAPAAKAPKSGATTGENGGRRKLKIVTPK